MYDDEYLYNVAIKETTLERKCNQFDDHGLLILNTNELIDYNDSFQVKVLNDDGDEEYNIRGIIDNIKFNSNIKVMLIYHLNLKDSNLYVREKIINKLHNYIKLTIIRELIIENLRLIKNEKIIENKLNYYKKYQDIINDLDKLGCNISFKNELYDLIKEYEIQLKYSITKFDLKYSLFNLLTTKEYDGEIITDIEKVRLNNSLRKGKRPRSEYKFQCKFEELKKILKVYFKVENNINSKGINKDFNRYLVFRELKGIEMLYLNSYKVKPSIERYKKLISDIDSKYYDFFLNEDIMKYVIENTDIISLNKLISEIIYMYKKNLKKALYKNTNIYTKVDIINELSTYRLDEFELEGIHDILEYSVNEEEIDLEEIKKIKKYIIK